MKKILKSGATLEITMSPFVIGHKLFKAVAKEVGKVDIKIGSGSKSLEQLMESNVGDEVLNTLKNIFVSILASDEVEELLWVCMERAIYNNQKVTKDLFDNGDIASDYLEVAKEVMVLNLTPFTKGLRLLFEGNPLSGIIGSQK